MIGAFLSALGGIAKISFGCLKMGIKGIRAATRMGKSLSRNLVRAFKKGKKLGQGVVKVIGKCRSIAKQAKELTSSKPLEEAHVFTPPNVITQSRQLSNTQVVTTVTTTTTTTTRTIEPELKKSHLFTKEEK